MHTGPGTKVPVPISVATHPKHTVISRALVERLGVVTCPAPEPISLTSYYTKDATDTVICVTYLWINTNDYNSFVMAFLITLPDQSLILANDWITTFGVSLAFKRDGSFVPTLSRTIEDMLSERNIPVRRFWDEVPPDVWFSGPLSRSQLHPFGVHSEAVLGFNTRKVGLRDCSCEWHL